MCLFTWRDDSLVTYRLESNWFSVTLQKEKKILHDMFLINEH